MTFWWKLGLTAAFLAAYAAAVWRVHDWYDGSKEAKQLVAEQKATKDEMHNSFNIDRGFNELITDLGTFQNSIYLSTAHETPLPDCRYTAGRVSALRQAIGGNPAAR